ncbi:MAG: SLC26A/SulP transporter family protein [Legionellales bacterium]|nr:SLC26A/SulP transporter family protein [Legionellales bacterium]
MKFSNIKKEIFSGISTSIIALPKVAGLGVFILSPLGEQYTSLGVSMGVASTIFLTFLITLIGKIPPQVLTPAATTSFVLLDITSELTKLNNLQNINLTPEYVLVCLTIILTLAAIFQILFGSLKLGGLIQYIPYPVTSGFLNGVGILFVLYQWKFFLGLNPREIYTFNTAIENLSIWDFSIGLITVLALFSAKEWSKRYPNMPPSPIIGMIIGVSVYYYVGSFGTYNLGGVIGKIDFSFTDFIFLPTAIININLSIVKNLSYFLIKSAFILAAIMTLTTLLETLLIETLSDERYDKNHMIKTHGIAHLFSSMFGGLVGSNSVTIFNIFMNGRTRISSISFCITLLTMFLFFKNIIEGLPSVVIAANFVYLGLNIIDLSGIKLLVKIKNKKRWYSTILSDQLISILVTICTLIFGLAISISIGIICVVLMYMNKANKLLIRNIYTEEELNSGTIRTKQELDVLSKYKKKIMIFELQGVLFFGIANHLFQEIEKNINKGSYFILDFKYSSGADTTAIKTLEILHKYLSRRNKYLFCSGVRDNDSIYEIMNNLNFIDVIGEKRIFHSLEMALKNIEDNILHSFIVNDNDTEYSNLSQVEILNNFHEKYLSILHKFLKRNFYTSGELIQAQDDTPKKLYMIASGEVECTYLNKCQPSKFFLSGDSFGIDSLFSEIPKLNSVIAKTNVEIYSISVESFKNLSKKYPRIGLLLCTNILSTIILHKHSENIVSTDS